MELRSEVSKSLQIFNKLEENKLPSNSEVVGHFFYLRKNLSDSNQRFVSKTPCFHDVKGYLVRDVVALWHKAGLPIVSEKRVATKLKETVNRYNAARKRAKNRVGKIEEEW